MRRIHCSVPPIVALGLVLAGLTSPLGFQLDSPRAVHAQASDDASTAAFAAARDLLHGVSQADCLQNNPGRLSCLALESVPADVERGIAVFGVGDPDGNGGFDAVMGHMADGSWKLWFTSQNPYQPTRLPGEMAVCAGGDGVNVRASASTDASVVDHLPDGAHVTGEEFLLTEPAEPGHQGFGWFRISAPDAGWIYSKYLEAATLDDACALHNAQVGAS